MQVVIDIPKEMYENALNGYLCGSETIVNAIKNGVPIPKGHGRLVDADELQGDFIDGTEGYDCQTWNRIEIGDVIDSAPTIIEADRSEEDG